jgi:hypothetical protein
MSLHRKRMHTAYSQGRNHQADKKKKAKKYIIINI